MFFIQLLRWFLGYVRFGGKNGFTERFINLCHQSGIPLWALKSGGDGFSACTTVKGYKKIRRSAHRSGVRLRIAEKKGLPFFAHKYRRRCGLLAGAVFFIAVTSLLSARIWFIEVEGNVTMSDAAIISAFEEMGVRVGRNKKDIKPTFLQMEAYTKLPELSWAAVNIEGSTATIEVREKVNVPEMLDESTPCNVRALRAGQILMIKAYEGKTEAEIGSAVAAGDLLINGITENADGTPVLRHARGEVIAKTEHEINITQPRQFKCMKTTGEKSTSLWIYFFGIKIPVFTQKPPEGFFETEITEKYFYIGKTKMPLGIIKKRDVGWHETTVTLSKEEAELYAAVAFNREYEQLLENVKIISESLGKTESENGVDLKGIFSCEENIAYEEPIDLQVQTDAAEQTP